MKAQTDSRIKLMAQSPQDRTDDLKRGNATLRTALKEQSKKVESISGRQKDLLKRCTEKLPVASENPDISPNLPTRTSEPTNACDSPESNPHLVESARFSCAESPVFHER